MQLIFHAYFVFSKQEVQISRSTSFADDGEALDGMITRSRGEIRRMCSLKLTSSTATPAKEFKSLQSPDKVFSPRVSELRGNQNPWSSGRGPFSPKNGEARMSNLGKSG